MLGHNPKWTRTDTVLFIMRSLWVYVQSSNFHHLPRWDDPVYRVGMIIWAGSAFLIPYLFYRPGFKNTPFYVAADAVLTGSFFLHVIHEVPDVSLFSYIYLPSWIYGFISQRRPMVWLSPVLCLGIFIGGALISGLYLDADIFISLTDYCIFYTIGFFMGKTTVTNEKMKGLLASINEKNKTLEQYAKRVEELTIAEERSRVSKDLHDTVGHIFTSVITTLDALPFIMKANPEAAEQSMKELADVARKGLDDVRKTIHQMSDVKGDGSVSEELMEIMDDFQRHTHTEIAFKLSGLEREVPAMVKHTLVRCLQEALTNAKRHGAADYIKVTLTFDENGVSMEVADHGVGNDQLQWGFGLSAMKDRIQTLQGTLHTESKRGEGTKLLCSIPLSKEEYSYDKSLSR